VQYVAEQLQGWGYQPRLQSFPVQTFEDRGSSLDVAPATAAASAGDANAGAAGGGEGTHIAADTLLYSAAGDVQALLVAAGSGRAEDFASVDARGKLALVERGELRFSDKLANAAAAGALGLIVYNDSPERVQGSLVGPGSLPAVTIDGATGQQLLGQLATGPLSAHLRVDASTEQRSGTNVLAELPAGRPDAPTVVFGAHLDSVPAGPGGNDNGSGVGVVLELAHNLAQRDARERPYRLRFVLFGAEELGLYGSHAYVQSLSDVDRQNIVAMLNLDMVGVGDQWRFGGSDDLVQLALGAANDLGVRALPLRGPLAGASDHASFLDAGVPAVFLYRVEDPNYHTAGDRPELVDADALEQAGKIALGILDALPAANGVTG
jgi:aminopeptidase YwaD